MLRAFRLNRLSLHPCFFIPNAILFPCLPFYPRVDTEFQDRFEVPLHLAPLHALHAHGSPVGTKASEVFAPQPPPRALRLPASTRSLPQDTAAAHLRSLNLPPEPGYAPYPASSTTPPSSRTTVGGLRSKPPRKQQPQSTAIVPATTTNNSTLQQQQPPASSSSTSSNVFQLTAMVPGETSGISGGLGSTSSHLNREMANPSQQLLATQPAVSNNDDNNSTTMSSTRRRRRLGAAPPEELRGGFQDHQYHTYKLKLVASPLFEVASTSASWPKAGRRPDGSFRGGWSHPDFHPDTAMLKVCFFVTTMFVFFRVAFFQVWPEECPT